MRFRAGWAIATLILLITSLVLLGVRGVLAADGQPPGPDRFATSTQTYTLYKWWLTSWATDKSVCTIKVDHDGLPTSGEIYSACGDDNYQTWITTQECSKSDLASNSCEGYYLVLVGSEQAKRPIVAEIRTRAGLASDRKIKAQR